MNTEESAYKTKLVAQCRKAGAYARRIEDRFAVGILDVMVAFSGFPVCLIEGKIIHGRHFAPTERQYIEGQRVLAIKGGHILPVLVGWSADTGLLHVGEWTRTLPIKACRVQGKYEDFAKTLWSWIDDYQRQRGIPSR